MFLTLIHLHKPLKRLMFILMLAKQEESVALILLTKLPTAATQLLRTSSIVIMLTEQYDAHLTNLSDFVVVCQEHGQIL